MTADVNATKIYFIDERMNWYHDCFDEVLSILAPYKNKRIVAIGQSMGGYGALLFAHLMDAESLSFSPQTFLSKELKEKYDMRWEGRILNIAKWTKHKEYLDLLFINGKHHHIYYGEQHKEDSIHATMLSVCHHPIPYEGHAVAQWLKKKNVLKDIIERRVYGYRCN